MVKEAWMGRFFLFPDKGPDLVGCFLWTWQLLI